jgi:hypothetical protein
MLRLFDRLPDEITVDGKQYALDLDFRNVLRMTEIMQREDLLAESRNYLSLRCIMPKVPPDTLKAMKAVNALLFPNDQEKKGGEKGPKATDYDQDADMIRAAFMQSYGINLWREKLHWFEFTALLANLPDGSRYTDVVNIRLRPLPEPTRYNAKERQWLIDAKARYAIQMTEKELEEARNASFHATTLSLLRLAKRGGDLNA